jgi:sirohydrochlorin cobaltochelatase
MVVRALRKRGMEKYTVSEAVANLRQAKNPVLVVNVQLLDGVMTDKLQADLRLTGMSADSIRYTSPLLYNSDDARWLARTLAKHIKANSDEEVVLVGHGSNDSANAMYALIDYVMQHEVDERYHVGTIENYPDLDMIIKILHAKQVRKVVLYPLLLIAGNHALQDIQGDWKDKLEKTGYSVRVIREGLLEIPEVQQRIIDKINNKLY